ncbi:hypothetical protein CRUP_015035 [Coryphaenoides rupestris]|nr:hypothetical protein CRUP_015035 [Coryphaenoides rupestris]
MPQRAGGYTAAAPGAARWVLTLGYSSSSSSSSSRGSTTGTSKRVLQAMAVLVCAEMYQVKRLQHLCEVCVCAYLQSMPSRELASTGISVIRLLRRAKRHRSSFHQKSYEEREHVERLRWPSRGYLQELSEYQQRRRKLRKSRCSVM